jgi:hypothetical protein
LAFGFQNNHDQLLQDRRKKRRLERRLLGCIHFQRLLGLYDIEPSYTNSQIPMIY